VVVQIEAGTAPAALTWRNKQYTETQWLPLLKHCSVAEVDRTDSHVGAPALSCRQHNSPQLQLLAHARRARRVTEPSGCARSVHRHGPLQQGRAEQPRLPPPDRAPAPPVCRVRGPAPQRPCLMPCCTLTGTAVPHTSAPASHMLVLLLAPVQPAGPCPGVMRHGTLPEIFKHYMRHLSDKW